MAFAYWKIAVIVEGVYRRWLNDPTNGSDAGTLQPAVPRLGSLGTRGARRAVGGRLTAEQAVESPARAGQATRVRLSSKQGASDVAQDKQPRRQVARTSSRAGPGAKRERIIQVAVGFFGRHGYEQTKWADVATEVDIGSTALYHYFESKEHCLLEIMDRTLVDVQERFERIVASHDDWTDALLEALVSGFDLTDEDVLKLRVLAAQHHRVATPRSAPREEAARASARSRKRDLEYAWSVFLVRGMEQGALPRNDAQLLARAVLGLYNSVWAWYRPGGKLGLQDVARFFVGRQLALLGARPGDGRRSPRRARARLTFSCSQAGFRNSGILRSAASSASGRSA